MTDRYCDYHREHSSLLTRHGRDIDQNELDHKEIWTEIKKKMSVSWLIILVPVIMAWIGFQLAIYDSVKNVETKVAVIQTEINTYIKASNKRMD